MVVQGQDTTLPVTLDEMVYHTRMVARGRQRALVLGDLPFGSYQASPRRAVESAVRLVKEGGAEAVKLEGGLAIDRKSTRLNSSHITISYAVFCLKKKKKTTMTKEERNIITRK